MLDTPVVNVAIGLVFCFAATALAASTVTEAIASLLKLRANTLVAGVQKMLNDPKFDGLALQIYRHALVHPEGDGGIASRSRFWTYAGPSYIKAQDFATATIDVLRQGERASARLEHAVDGLDPQLRQLLGGMLLRADGDLDHLHGQIADWFDTAMDRVSGSYKRRSQLISFAIGLVIAAALNIDAIHVVAALWKHPTQTSELASRLATADGRATAAATLQELKQLPVGWDLSPDCAATSTLPCLARHQTTAFGVVGWLITAVAAVFGAPFWFDLLQRLVQLRGSGPKPAAAKR